MQRIPALLLLFVAFAATALAQRAGPWGNPDLERRIRGGRGPIPMFGRQQENPDMKPMFGRGEGNRGGPSRVQTGGRRFDGRRDEFPTEVNGGPESRPVGFRRDQDRPQRFGPGGRRPDQGENSNPFGRWQGNRGGPSGVQTGGRRFDGPRFDGRGDEFPMEVNDGPESRPMGSRRDQDRPQRFGPGGRRPNEEQDGNLFGALFDLLFGGRRPWGPGGRGGPDRRPHPHHHHHHHHHHGHHGGRNESEEADHDHDNEGPDGDEAGNFTGPFGFRPWGGRPFGRRPFGRRNDTEDGDNDFHGEERPFRPRPFGGRRPFDRRNCTEGRGDGFRGEGRRNKTESFKPHPFGGRRPFDRRNGTEGRGDGFRGDRFGKPHFGRRNETDVDGQKPFKRPGGRGSFGGRGDIPFKGRGNTKNEVDATTPAEQPAEPVLVDTNAIDGGNVVF